MLLPFVEDAHGDGHACVFRPADALEMLPSGLRGIVLRLPAGFEEWKTGIRISEALSLPQGQDDDSLA